MPVNGKKTPENLAIEMASDFFSTIGHERSFSGVSAPTFRWRFRP
jgi:hypothetical protein